MYNFFKDQVNTAQKTVNIILSYLYSNFFLSFQCNSTIHTHCYVRYMEDAKNTNTPVKRWNRKF